MSGTGHVWTHPNSVAFAPKNAAEKRVVTAKLSGVVFGQRSGDGFTLAIGSSLASLWLNLALLPSSARRGLLFGAGAL